MVYVDFQGVATTSQAKYDKNTPKVIKQTKQALKMLF